MSIAALNWAFHQNIKPSWLKFALVALADCANDEGVCWPSVKHLCVKTSQDRKTILASLATLAKMGFLADTGKRQGRTNQVKVLRLTVPSTAPLPNERVPPVPRKGTVRDTKESRRRDTEPSRTTIEPLREDLSTRLKNMIASFERVGNMAKADRYRTELAALAAKPPSGEIAA